MNVFTTVSSCSSDTNLQILPAFISDGFYWYMGWNTADFNHLCIDRCPNIRQTVFQPFLLKNQVKIIYTNTAQFKYSVNFIKHYFNKQFLTIQTDQKNEVT